MLLNEHEMGELFKVIAFTKGLRRLRAAGLRQRRPAPSAVASMIRWLIVVFLALIVFNAIGPGSRSAASAGCRATSASACSAVSGSCRSAAAS